MGYTTNLKGSFKFNRSLTVAEFQFLKDFFTTRRVKRDSDKLLAALKGKNGMPNYQKKDNRTAEEIYGKEGEYYGGMHNSVGVIDDNTPPSTQPSLWCDWRINDDGTEMECREGFGETNEPIVEWVKYLIQHFFAPWGVILNGEVEWDGEESDDIGMIVVTDNVVDVKYGLVTYHTKEYF